MFNSFFDALENLLSKEEKEKGNLDDVKEKFNFNQNDQSLWCFVCDQEVDEICENVNKCSRNKKKK